MSHPGSRLAVIGAGSWGTALAIVLAHNFSSVSLWARDERRALDLATSRENRLYLPGCALPPQVCVTSCVETALRQAEIVIFAVPSRFARNVLESMVPHVTPGMKFVSATKGLENETLLRMSQLLANILTDSSLGRVSVLSGPAFAKEVAAGEPAAIVVAATDPVLAAEMQSALSTPELRLYRGSDVVGVEIGAALKNVIAIGAGMCRGLGLGSNSVAALITRGLAEIARLAVSLGGQPRTLAGLSGLGDLVLTATGDLSRNRQVGIDLALGRSLQEIQSASTMVAEGISTCKVAYVLGKLQGIELPIVQRMHDVLYDGKNVRRAIRELMDRPLTSE